ncbi:MAG TPA: GlsB/YeaQ/YmgE family stress response membrane protein [Pseudomonadota bacterium]|jgi:uncharacterized membrane protein YeaQ/YmgE (transglycosylase-associated protein family)|nr:GlsB/YeaQ/YmgE family stress response membrane protein [Xanthomonadales bacterium]HQW63073.1 GlsB/YeaQ/YmgE family stress response membrane protein [Pseudomonadota bacterium]MBP7419053.1 GlsB/YeaQ/YmgE family stress response membrane protein [Xanthomonadales bacterium]MBP8177129.1 GlsB/YeaQ/YmgE family stress response membrane protein [Xanthomonadales bacterium]HQX23986.1 GlsB/YeaQ/YmgE family stress response membrane protein [Pseudomonadota bacterium]
MSLLYTILIGFLVGLVARALKPGDDKLGFLLTIAVGIGGSLLATYGGQALGYYAAGERAGFIAATLGAIAILFVYGMVRKGGNAKPPAS